MVNWQGLKFDGFIDRIGTIEVVPCYKTSSDSGGSVLGGTAILGQCKTICAIPC
jgi:hypothetical protein